MSKLSNACAISPKVKQIVLDRDEYCILCGKPGFPNAHYISRKQEGLGIEQNIVTLCQDCHDKYDKTVEKKTLKPRIKAYLDKHYPGFSDEDRLYKKYQ